MEETQYLIQPTTIAYFRFNADELTIPTGIYTLCIISNVITHAVTTFTEKSASVAAKVNSKFINRVDHQQLSS